MKYFNPYLNEYKALIDSDEQLTKTQKYTIGGTLNNIDEFENSIGKSIMDMTLSEFEKIREGWFQVQTARTERRKILCLIKYMEWYNQNKGVIVDFKEKITFLNKTSEYKEYRDSNYMGIFVKDFDALFSLSTTYKYALNRDIDEPVSDPGIVSIVFCYNSGLLLETGLIKSKDVAGDYSSFIYDGKEYEIPIQARNYLKLYDEQKIVVAQSNQKYYKSESEYFIKMGAHQRQLDGLLGKPCSHSVILNRIRLLNSEFCQKYSFPNMSYTKESIFLSGYFDKAIKEIELDDSDLKWREYFIKHKFRNKDNLQMLNFKNAYAKQMY